MRKNMKTLSLFASGLIVFGLIIALVGFFSGAHYSITLDGTSFKVNDQQKLKSESLPLEAFQNIDGQINDADISFISANEYKIEIKYPADQEWNYKVENGTLFIKHTESPQFSFNLGFVTANQATIKIYVPKDQQMKQFKLINKYGDTSINGIASQSMDIVSNDGDLKLVNVNTEKLAIVNQYGDTTVQNVSADKISAKSNDGDMLFKNMNVLNAFISNQYGDTALQQINSKGLKLTSNDGDVSVKGSLKGRTVIHSNYGDVLITPSNPQKELSYRLVSDYGDIIVDNKASESSVVSSENGDDSLKVNTQDGDIVLSF